MRILGFLLAAGCALSLVGQPPAGEALLEAARVLDVPPLGTAQEVQQAYADAATRIEAHRAAGNAETTRLADSLLMEVHMASAYAASRYGLRAEASQGYRSAVVLAARHATFTSRRVEAVTGLAQVLEAAADPAGAEKVLIEAQQDFLEAQDLLSARRLLRERAYLYNARGDASRAMRTHTEVLDLDKRLQDERGQAYTELDLCRTATRLGSLDAFDHARNAFDLAGKAGDTGGQLAALDLLIASYDLTGQDARCEELISTGTARARERGVVTDIARFEDRAGRFYLKKGDVEKAVTHLRSGIAALEGSTGSTGTGAVNPLVAARLAELHQDLGRCYRAKGDIEQALSSFKASANYLVDGQGGAAPWADLAELHLARGAVAEATMHAERALEEGRLQGDADLLLRASRCLYRIFKERGDPVRALAMHELSTRIGDSIGRENFRMGLLRKQLETGYRETMVIDSLANANAQEQLRMETRIARTRTTYLLIGGLVLFAAAGTVAFIDRKRKKARFEKEAAQLETQALRSQMNPHFIFNALNSINAYVQGNDPDNASSYLSKFARVMRSVLENSRHAEVPLANDLETLRGYLDLERKRMREKFDYTIEVDEELDAEEVLVPPLVVQPFVENAIWHGMNGKEGKGHIRLRVEPQGGQLLWIIEDDGVGRDAPKQTNPQPDAPVKKTSLGTAITRARLDLVQKQYGGKAGFRYVDRPAGTRVEVDMPLRVG